MKNTAIWWSYHIPLNYVSTLSLCFCYCQKNLMKTWIKLAGGNGSFLEQLLFIMWSLDQHYIFLCKNAKQFFVAHFCNFELFYCLLPFCQEIKWKFDFISNINTWKRILLHLKKFCHLGTMLYCLWNIKFIKTTISLDAW